MRHCVCQIQLLQLSLLFYMASDGDNGISEMNYGIHWYYNVLQSCHKLLTLTLQTVQIAGIDNPLQDALILYLFA